MCALAGSSKVVVTDYSDEGLLDNLRFNVDVNLEGEEKERIDVDGHVWGQSVDPLLDHLSKSQKYDLLILSDLVFNHSQVSLFSSLFLCLTLYNSSANLDKSTTP